MNRGFPYQTFLFEEGKMIPKRLEEYLNHNRTHFGVIHHHKTMTAQKTAQSVHIKGKEFAKTVLLEVDGQPMLAVIPAHLKVSMKHVKEITGARDVWIASEEEIKNIFEDCEIGAIPAFGNLYRTPMLVDDAFSETKSIAFAGGTHEDVVQMKFSDYQRLVHPKFAHIHR